ncbi:MAG: HU family DNA-binding protein [Phycisphaeraceae bacterium]|nr:HU family DNA-binding protein [Phycisphaeraceae bacterium]
MNKGDLIDQVAMNLNTSKTDASKAVEAVLECITQGLKQQEKVTISGFGTFVKRQRAARTGINPVTKQPISIAASTTCGFKPATALKAAL